MQQKEQRNTVADIQIFSFENERQMLFQLTQAAQHQRLPALYSKPLKLSDPGGPGPIIRIDHFTGDNLVEL
jgi:hypothetical protein